MRKGQTTDYEQTPSMIITIDGQHLDDRLEGRSLTFRGAGFAYDERPRSVYTIYASPNENPPPAFGGNSIPLDVLYCCLGVQGADLEGARASPFRLVFSDGSLVFKDYRQLGTDCYFLSSTPYKLMVERVAGTDRRIYPRGSASLLRDIGVRLRIPDPSMRGS